MSQVVAYLTNLIDRCTQAGIRATLDPRSTNPPCVLFTPPTLTVDMFNGAAAECAALVLVPGPGNADAFAALDVLTADLVRNVLTDTERIQPAQFSPDDVTNQYPANEVSWTASLDWPDPC